MITKVVTVITKIVVVKEAVEMLDKGEAEEEEEELITCQVKARQVKSRQGKARHFKSIEVEASQKQVK